MKKLTEEKPEKPAKAPKPKTKTVKVEEGKQVFVRLDDGTYTEI